MTADRWPLLSPSARRVLKALERDLSLGSVALFLGAGVDLALNQEARDWESLVADLSNGFVSHSAQQEASQIAGSWTREKWTSLARQWPTETASLMRWLLGDRRFIKEIAELLQGKPKRTDFSEILCQLALQVGLVVTTNYTPIVKRAIEDFLVRAGDTRKLRVFDRESLPSLDVIGKIDRERECVIVHLHGRFTPSSVPILDAWGYNILSNDDATYSQFLHTLFASLDVITVGVSWADIPLRNAAALVRRTRPFVYRHHLALMFHSTTAEAGSYAHRAGARTLWTRAVRATLGVEIIHVSAGEQQAMLESLVRASFTVAAESSPPRRQQVDFDELADFLDDCGDYESRDQSQWLMEYGRGRGYNEPSEARAIEAALDHLMAEALARLHARCSRRDWEVFARIERHLRHHAWLYASTLAKGKGQRRALWEGLLANIPSRWNRLSAALRFDFVIGHYELERREEIPQQLTEIRDELLAMRLAEASTGVWTGSNAATASEAKAMRLVWLGWESMGAKVLGDRLMRMAKERSEHMPQNVVDSAATMISGAHEMLAEANRAEAMARLAGCSRRIVKAVTIGSMWNPDPQNARLRVLGELSAPQALKTLEPGIYRGVAAALLSCDLRARLDRGLTSPVAVRRDADEGRRLAEEVDGMLEESGVERPYRREAMEDYWLNAMPPHLAQIVRVVRECPPFLGSA
jgi:hypothetical protein